MEGTAVIHAQILKLDPANRKVVVATDDGRELTLDFPENANIEVYEPCTTGTMGGTLADLLEGYWVNLAIGEPHDGVCRCTSLVSES
ncbi:MAG: hypothetical protein ACREJG_11515 [Candidatus Rokuibacteriota bacterium]